jgi:hypothetical protein
MNTVSKSSSLQAYTMLLMRKPVHPEFFGIESRRQLTHGDFDVEAWIYKGGHAVRFQQCRRGEQNASQHVSKPPGLASAHAGNPVGRQPKGQADPRSGLRGAAAGRSNGSSKTSGKGPSAPDAAPICLCEVVTEQPELLLDGAHGGAHGGGAAVGQGAAQPTCFPCAGERDHEEQLGAGVLFMTTLQTETLTEHLYVGTYKEMMQHVRESNSLFSAWTDELGRPNLSLLDLQRYRNEVHVQSYHLRSDCGLVLRTQSMFQVEGLPAMAGRSIHR